MHYLQKQKKPSLSQSFIEYFTIGIWRSRLQDLPYRKSIYIHPLRVFVLAFRKFDSDNCSLRASSLTFYALLSIVPVVAMIFGIAMGFGYEDVVRDQLLQRFSGQEEVFTIIIGFAHTLLANTRGGMVAGIGVAVLLWTVIKVLYHIEFSFNEIWEVKSPRTFRRKIINYISIMIIGPILLVTSGSVTVFISSHILLATQKFAFISFLGPSSLALLKLMPYILIWAIFTLVYRIMPNVNVSLQSALLGAVIAGTGYQFVQWVYIHFQVGIARYNAIYGSFAALPLFLIWLEISWLIVLFGAELSYAHQNVQEYEFEHDSRKASPYLKKILALQVAHFFVKSFSKEKGVLSAAIIHDALNIPYLLLHRILDDLVETGVILRAKGEFSLEPKFQIAMDINKLRVNSVMDALDKTGVNTLPVTPASSYVKLTRSVADFKTALDENPANRLLKDI